MFTEKDLLAESLLNGKAELAYANVSNPHMKAHVFEFMQQSVTDKRWQCLDRDMYYTLC